jgi:rSAM/selenodomain-associated transferase 2/rSAM/selenodomain-associated transferase 1
LEIRFAGGDANAFHHWLGDGFLCRPQRGGDLGERMAGALADSFREGSPATVIIGSDCPSLTPEILAAAFESLKANPVVFGPATDGGYYLIGLTRTVPELFQGIAWGTETVLAQSLAILSRNGCKPALLLPLDDLDRPEDVAAWKRLVEVDDTDLSRVSVIIPTLNEVAHIAATLESARKGSPQEIIVVDGGSADETCAVAQKSGATVIHSKPGRARQMNAGAAQATGNVLLFVHADTLLPDNWTRVVADTLRQPGVVAGSFGFRVAESFPGRWLVELTTNLRSRWFQNPYGDQTQFLRRAMFEELGGFADLPIMEDYELNQRLRKLGRVVTAKAAAITSGRRWKRLGVVRTTLTNKAMIAGFHLGVCPNKLARFYRRSPAGN